MELNHLALNINNKDEVDDFYVDVLGMKIINTFEINNLLSSVIFNINGCFPVFMLNKGNVYIELFLSGEKIQLGFSHTCINVPDKENILTKAKNKGYKTTVIERENNNLVFIYDKAGNPFEIKQSL